MRLYDAGDPNHVAVASSVLNARESYGELMIAPQILYEMRTVLTRPVSDNGFGFSAARFNAVVRDLREAATLLPDPPDLVDRWLALCERCGTIGKRSHDARIAAWMEAHGVGTILTLNPRDFAGFPIQVLSLPTF